MTVRDIQHHLASTLGTDLNHETISKITDQISQEVLAWQHRPLDGLYPVIYLDAIMIKVRDGAHVTNKAAYIAVGVDMDGIKHVLGIWVQASEGARFWAQVCAELANRGIKDVLIVCCDGLTGLPKAIEATWPQATVQTCVVHLIRAATRFVSYSDRKAVAAALRRSSRPPARRPRGRPWRPSRPVSSGSATRPRSGPSPTPGSDSLPSWPSRRWCDGSSLPHFAEGTPSTNASRLRATSCARSPGTGVTSPPTRQRSSCRKLAICNTRGQESPTTAKGAAQRTGRQERDHRQTDRGRYNHQLEASPPTAVPGLSRPNQPPPITHATHTNNLTGSRRKPRCHDPP